MRMRLAISLGAFSAALAAHAQVRPDTGSTLDSMRDTRPLPRAEEPVLKLPAERSGETAPAARPKPAEPAPAAPRPAAPAADAADTDPQALRLKALEADIARQLEIMSFQMDALRQELAKLRGQMDRYTQESKQARGIKGDAALAAGGAAPAPGVAAPEAASAAQDVGPQKVAVRGFRFTGASVLDEAALNASVARFVGQTLDLEDLEGTARAVRQVYLDKGYFLTQTYLPEQDIKGGVVEIAILEGRLGRVEVQIDDDANVPASLVRGLIEQHLKPGDHITETSLEKPLLLLRDLPRVTAESTIQPGAEVGRADLIVRVRRNPNVSLLTGTVDFDNYGNRFTGEYRLGVTANLNNPFGLGDFLSLRAFIPDNTDTLFGRVGYVLPVGHYGTKVGVNFARLNYGIGEEFASLRADGTAEVFTAYAVHPLIRTRAANLFLQAAVEDKRLVDRQASVGLREERKVQAAKFQVSGDARDRWLGLNVASATLTLGDMEPVSPGLLAADQSAVGFKTAGGFMKWNFEAQRLQQITPELNLLLSFAAQTASKNLTSAEKMNLGGPSAVRAYPVGEAAGDEGYTGSLELRYTVPGLKLGSGEVMGTVFYDFGQVRLNAKLGDSPAALLTGGNKRTLAGWGLGLNVGRDGDYMLRSSLAWRLDEAPTSDLAAKAARQPRLWVQAIKWF